MTSLKTVEWPIQVTLELASEEEFLKFLLCLEMLFGRPVATAVASPESEEITECLPYPPSQLH